MDSRMESSCLDLALEGERLCKAGHYRTGVSFFESAIQVGTEDLQILSAIYSQLGNAYFHQQEYPKALEYHSHDLTLTRTIGDELGEAKASGNLGNTLKLLGRFDEAGVCCQRHLDITRAMYDRVGQARALYNFGNVYHAKGKSICWIRAEPGEFPEDARTALKKATQFYEANLSLVQEMGDGASQGRTYGNLGNTYYLLGDFEKAVSAHEKRLLIAKEFGDKSAERRGHCNLGNAHIFLGQFDVAAGHYKRTLQLARQLKDRAVEAQACYSLGNTCTLLQDYERAIDYHLKHLLIAQDLEDRVGEGRACWSLGNAHTALGNHEQAMHFAEKHLEIAKESGSRDTLGEDGFFDLLSRFQGSRMDDQRCSLLERQSSVPVSTSPWSTLPVAKKKCHLAGEVPSWDQGHFLELMACSQGCRPDDQRVSESHFPGFRLSNSSPPPTLSTSKPEQANAQAPISSSDPPPTSSRGSHLDPSAETPEGNDFFAMLMKCQGSRLDDQRCAAPPPAARGLTVPDEDFLSLILRS
ncbi:G-protein-signaling modulator 2 [Gadus morhua]|uniref:G-protein-signaling modulator 2 n=1 Tax=Gadus morhua TaxID=8049 RepID=UPI0011B77779|nr:G-protein-signaling modulator 2-like [Gadus morhua]